MDIVVPVVSPETVQVSPPAPQTEVIVNQAGIKGDPGADGVGSPGPVGPQGPPGELASYYDVKNYGAIGDGSTDDTAAIISAATAANLNGGGTVFFPTGNYLISAALPCATGVSWMGTGSEASIITQTSTTAGVFVGTDVASMSIEALLLQGPGSGTANGIDLGWVGAGNLPFLHFTDVWVRDFGASGIALQTPIVSHFDRVIVQDNGAHGFDLYHAGTSCVFTACWARSNAQAGYHFFESVYMNLAGCAADNNGIGYLVESAQSISFDACGAEAQLLNGGSYNGIGFKIANSSVININSAWITDNRNIGIWITDGSQEVKINAADNSPNVSAVNFIKTDVATNSTIYELHNTTANSLSAGTANIMNDGALGVQVKSFKVKDASGTLNITAAPDGGEYNLFADTTGVLALYGAGGQALNVNLLDGYLQLSPLTATTVPYLDGNKRFVSSAVTPTELGYVSGVTSALQTQLNAKQSTITFGTGVQTALGINIGSAGAPVLFNGVGGTPSSLTLTNATGLPVGSITGLGANVGTALTSALNGSGAIVATTSPTLVTPVLGVATATSINKLTITQPASGATLTIADGGTLALAGAFTFTPTLAANATPTFPSGAYTVATVTTTQTLTGKTATGLILTAGSTTVAPITFSGAGALMTTPTAHKIEWDGTDLYYVQATGPTRRKVANLDSTQTFSNKTLTSPIISTISNTGTLTLPTSTDTLVGKATTDVFTNKTYDTAGAGNVFKINGTTVSSVTGTGSVNVLQTSPTITTPSIDTINSAAASHLVLNAGTSKLVKLTTLRQDDTTNTYKVGTTVILTGWGAITPGAAATATETITFGITFTQRPIVVATWGGDAPSGATYGGGGNNVKGLATCKAEVITTGGFDVRIRTTDGTNWGATDLVFYQWIAIGEL